MPGSNVVEAAISGMRYLILLQVASRVVTFILNTHMVIEISTEVFGIFSVQYQLIMSTILFLTREGFRKACQRANLGESGAQVSKVMNVVWLSVPLGVLISFGSHHFFKNMASKEELAIPQYEAGMNLFVIGCFLEILSEPVYILAQNLFLFRVRTIVEATAVFIRCIITYVLVVNYKLGLEGFGYAQIFYGGFLVVGYYGYFLFNVASFFDLFPSRKGGIDSKILKLWTMYEWQSVEKLILTEGEKFVLWSSASLVDQGIYSVVNNLGSLVARFLFQPVEEMCSAMFARLLGNSQNRDDLKTAVKVLRILTKFMIIVGLIFIAFGPNYSSFLLDKLFNNKFADTKASSVLAWYCVYVAVIALNGITEAFVHAVATSDELWWLNIFLISFSLVYVIAAKVFIGVLETSVVVISFFLIALKHGTSHFIQRLFHKQQHNTPFTVLQVLPNTKVLIVLLASFGVTWASGSLHPLLHLGVGAVFGLLALASVYQHSRCFI